MKFNLLLWVFKKYYSCDITVLSQDNSLDVISETNKFLTIDHGTYKDLFDRLPDNLKERSCIKMTSRPLSIQKNSFLAPPTIQETIHHVTIITTVLKNMD
jgi:hypothetical protein